MGARVLEVSFAFWLIACGSSSSGGGENPPATTAGTSGGGAGGGSATGGGGELAGASGSAPSGGGSGGNALGGSAGSSGSSGSAGANACGADLAVDIANCGTCGHACASGTACAQGQCVAPILKVVSAIARDDQYLYAIASTGFFRMPLSGGTPESLVASPPSGTTSFGSVLAVDEANAYIAILTSDKLPPNLYSAPKTGGSFAALATAKIASDIPHLTAMAGTLYYWQDDQNASDWGIYRVPTAGGVPELWEHVAGVTELGSASDTVVWSIYYGGPVTGLGVYTKASSSAVDLNFNFNLLPGTALTNGALAVDASAAYWSTVSGTVSTSPLNGDPASAIGADASEPSLLAVDDTDVYYDTCASQACSVKRLAKTGGAATTFANLPAATPKQIVAGEGGVYVLGFSSDLYRLPLN
ncbi:MAG TPA: hypothetical protein VGI10_13600 [Polyangiaceae bacterium]|jgi:hypothetical protein